MKNYFNLTVIAVATLLMTGVLFFFPKIKSPFVGDLDWEREKQSALREQQAQLNHEWFQEDRWLTDAEIDWTVEKVLAKKLTKEQTFKALPAYQFNYVAESLDQDAYLSLLTELKTNTKPTPRLIFIPVNNPHLHWSLLVYETKTKNFCHFDSVKGLNKDYCLPTVQRLLTGLLENPVGWKDHWQELGSLKQKNSCDCGVALLWTIEQIIKQTKTGWLWTTGIKQVKISCSPADLTAYRKILRNQYLTVN